MQRNDFYQLSGQQQQGYAPGMPGAVGVDTLDSQEKKIQEQQRMIQQQMAPAVTKAPPIQPHQKLNVISSRQADAIRSGNDLGNTGCPNLLIAKSAPKKVDTELIESFMMGDKNPVMALNEFCQKQRLMVKFQEDMATSWGTMCNPKFASVAIVDGVRHKQGVGRTKKEAKTQAAKVALSTLLGLTPDDVQDQDTGTAIYDSFGRKIVLHEEQPVSQTMTARPSTEKGFSAGGHYQVNYNTAPTITSEDAWNVAKPANYAEYQVKMAQQAKEQAQAGKKKEQPAQPTPQQLAQPTPQQPSNLSFGRGVLNPSIINSCLPGQTPGYQPRATSVQQAPGKSPPQTQGGVRSPAQTQQAASPASAVSGYWPQANPISQSASGSEFTGVALSGSSQQDSYDFQADLESDPFPKLSSAKMASAKPSQSASSIQKPVSQYKPFVNESVYDPQAEMRTSPFPQFGVQQKQPTLKVLGQPPAQSISSTRDPKPSSLSTSQSTSLYQTQTSLPRQTVSDPTSATKLKHQPGSYQPTHKPHAPVSYPTYQPQGPQHQPPNQLHTPTQPQPQAPSHQPLPQATNTSPPLTGGLTVADQIAQTARSIPRVGSPFPGCTKIEARRSLAAILLQRNPQAKHEIVGLGTGNGAITGRNITPDGRAILDLDGLTIARRGLQRYLYRELKNFYEGNQQATVFTIQRSSRLLTLKEGVTFHLYLNAAPCGDAARFVRDCPPTITEEDLYLMACGAHYPMQQPDTAQGKLTAVGQDGTPVAVDELPHVGSIDMAKKQNPLRVMSSSDKLLLWNIVGLQGALLSQFMEPVYLETITLGSNYDHGHLARAVCCRVDDDLTELLPLGYSVHHPLIGRVSNKPHVEDDFKTGTSLNWSFADSLYEVVDVKRGKCTESSPFKSGASGASRVCKAAFYSRFKNACGMAQRYDLQQGASYHEAKMMCKDYQNAKKHLAQHLKQKGYGSWLHLPADIGNFAK
ncbi:uncharacterized protein LOC119726260 [Patiria miniata]|uniref:Adenosine deaminase n=1 Tax=Patiria miniata TaxID=46514 RepID=A0A913ZRV8_PATMI|nr:uncharacterized protein LOC119726260 [Patiria miniata]